MKLYFFLIPFLLLTIFLQEIFSQVELDRRQYFDYGKRFYSNYYAIPSQSKDSVQLIFAFRVAYSLLAFQKFGSANPNLNRAIYSIDIELSDTIGVIRKRYSFWDTVIVENFDKAKSKEIYDLAFARFNIQNGTYNINIKMLNQNNYIVSKENYPKVNFINLDFSAGIGNLLYCYKIKGGENLFKPYLLGNAIAFTSNKAYIIVPVSWHKNQDNMYEYTLEKKSEKSRTPSWGNFETVNQRTKANIGKIAIERVNDTSIIIREIPKDEKTEEKIDDQYKLIAGYLLIEIPERNLVIGNYELKIHRIGSSDTIQNNFQIVWEDMPLSLQNVEYAIDIMYHILTDEEYKEMKRGNLQEQFDKLLSYWRKNDPSYGTAYNEAMAEYFKRVDYAYFNFQGIGQRDGAKTDRGKIYILNGKPTKIEQNLVKDKLIESWYYENLGTEYVFESISGGNYKLKKINQVKN